MSKDTQDKIGIVTEALRDFLSEKNRRYGDSAINPVKIFSKLSKEERLGVRMDDKMGRIMNSDELRKNDVVDLMGYLVLVCVSEEWLDFQDLLD